MKKIIHVFTIIHDHPEPISFPYSKKGESSRCLPVRPGPPSPLSRIDPV